MNTNTVLLGLAGILVVGGLVYYGTTKTTPSDINNISISGNTNTSEDTGARAPAAVTGTRAVPTDTTAVVTGTVTPHGAFTNYWYEYGTSSNLGTKTSNQTVGSGFTAIPAPAYITGLTKNTTYFFAIVAENEKGKTVGTQQSFKTTEGFPAPVGSAPNVETKAATGISRTTANLHGDVNPNKGTTQYWFEYGKSAQLGNTTAFTSLPTTSTDRAASLSLSDLTPDTTYYFRLNAQNQFGTTNGTILNFKTQGPSVVSAPSIKTENATAITASKATLRGTVTPNGADTTYWFEYSTDSLLGSVLLKSTDRESTNASSNTKNVSTNVSGLEANTTYYFRFVAENSAGVVRGERMMFKTNTQ